MVNHFVFGKFLRFSYPFLLVVIVSVSVFGQAKKGDLVVSPQVYFGKGMLEINDNYNSQHFELGSSLHYYLADRFAIGILFRGKYWNLDAKMANSFDRRTFEFSIMPEFQYNILKSRLTPFLKMQIGFAGYRWQKTADTTKPLRQRKTGNLILDGPAYAIGVSAGISYSIRENSSVFLSLNADPIKYFTIASTQIGLGCQFVLNRKK